ncbi:MAG: leucine-rich repeat domain-containing protein [Oscillospiraceae bacterium]
MRNITRIISFLTFLSIALICPNFSLYADESYVISASDPHYQYVENNDGTISIAANPLSSDILSGNITLPSALDNKTVTGICKNGFSEQEKITGVTVPDTITDIESMAFSNCLELKNVTLPDTLTNMGAMVFSNTEFEGELIKNAETGFITINDYILYIYYGKDTDITIPDGIRLISGSAFANNGYSESEDFKIKSVTIPDSVEYVGADAFYECDELKTAIMGTGLKSIGTNAFTCTTMTIYGYSKTYAQQYASSHDFDFQLIIPIGNYKYEFEYSDNFKQYYFSTDKEFSADGLKIYKRNYDGTKTEVTDWKFSGTPDAIYKAGQTK